MSKDQSLAIGIDLGTTFSAIARLDDVGQPRTLVNAEGDKTTPSVVLFDGREVVVGKEAVKAMTTEMSQVADCVKRELGARLYQKQISGRQFPPEAIQAWILNKLRVDSQTQVGSYKKVVITVPAYFDEVRRKATQDAGYIAGFEVLDIINEPTAAAISFGFEQGYLKSASRHEKKKILVYDLGGGTFDVTVMEVGGKEFVALATDGDVQLGGRDFDQRLVDWVAENFIRKFSIDPREDPNCLGRLWRDCEDAKRTLTARQKTSIACDYQGQASRFEISREKFEELTRDLLDRTLFTTRQTLKAAGFSWSDIDRVLLVGGSTRMPMVFDMLKKSSGMEPDRSVSPDEAVAHGAALHAGLLLSKQAGKLPAFEVTNVNSHSLGVVATDRATNRLRTAVLIPRNTPLPAKAKRTFKTQKAGQRSILIQIVEGESALPDDCSQVGKCVVRNLPPNLPAQTPIEVRFQYRENGTLTVMVHVESTEKQMKHEITRENSLTLEQLNHWRNYIAKLPPEIDSAAEVPQ